MEQTLEAAALLAALAGGVAGVVYLTRILLRLVRYVDRLHDLLAPTAATVNKELTANSGSSMKDLAHANRESIIQLRGLVQLVADEVADHGHKSRAALAIYRQALADQGIHLPVAPGEDGYQLDAPTTHRKDHR